MPLVIGGDKVGKQRYFYAWDLTHEELRRTYSNVRAQVNDKGKKHYE